MSHFQDVCAQVDALTQEPLFSRDAGVASEQHSKLAKLQDKSNGVVIDGILSTDERQRWSNERQSYAVIGMPHIAGARMHNRHVIGTRGIETIMIRVTAVRLSAIRNFRDTNL